MSPRCHPEPGARSRGRVVDLELVRIERLAAEIAQQLAAGHGNVVRLVASIDDVDRWRRAARRAGRTLGTRFRTGVSWDGQRVWAVQEV